MARQLILLLILLALVLSLKAQQKLGINTANPVRQLEVFGVEDQFVRVHSTSFGGVAGVELVRGLGGQDAPDWRIINDGGHLRFLHGNNNFSTGGTEAMRINAFNRMGIGTLSPASLLHVDGGTQLAFGGEGYVRIGHATSSHLAFDNLQLQSRQSGSPSYLSLQPHGGNTYFGNNGGDTYMGLGDGRVAVGTGVFTAGLAVQDDDFQFHIQNPANGTNGWYIGATNDNWVAGANQLVFSPSGSSSDAVLRLMNQDENDGLYAPVMIHSSTNHTLLLDGNEIDTRGTPLYINHNSDEETYINPNGGRVGIGTTNPQAKLHLDATNTDPLVLQLGNESWHLFPSTAGSEDLYFVHDNTPYARIHGQTGQWLHLSDERAKTSIRPLENVSRDLNRLKTYRYRMTADPTGPEHLGIIAQEAMELFPQMVYESSGQLGVGYGQLATLGIQAVQEQQALIATLRARIAQLKDIASARHSRLDSSTH